MAVVLSFAQRLSGVEPSGPYEWPWGEPQALGTEAETLAFLGPRLTSAQIVAFKVFTRGDWLRSERCLLNAIFVQDWSRMPLIVRASPMQGTSVAGSNLWDGASVEGVEGPAALRAAVALILSAYRDSDPRHQGVVQPITPGLEARGIALFADPLSGDVTLDMRGGMMPERARLMDVAAEVYALTGAAVRALSFGTAEDGALHILQVRLWPVPHWDGLASLRPIRAAAKSERRVSERRRAF